MGQARLRSYILKDTKANVHTLPMYVDNDDVAIRSVVYAALNDKEAPVHKFPEDFILFFNGYYCRLEGRYYPEDSVCLGKVLDLISNYRSSDV